MQQIGKKKPTAFFFHKVRFEETKTDEKWLLTTSRQNSDPKIVPPDQSSLTLDAAAVPVDGHGEGDAVVVGQQWRRQLSAV